MTETTDVVRFYTRGRRIPLMFGRFPDGTRIWGGPYTSVQFMGAAATLLVLWLTMPLWGRFGAIDFGVLLGVPFAVTVALRKAQLGGRSPRSVLAGLASAYVQPSNGRLRGRALPTPRHRSVRSTIVLGLPAVQISPDPTPVPAELPATPAPVERQRIAAQPTRTTPLAGAGGRVPTSLDLLLAAAAVAVSGSSQEQQH